MVEIEKRGCLSKQKGENSGYVVFSFYIKTMQSRLHMAPERRGLMNIRKPTDYSAVFSALDQLMASRLSQMELYCEIGRLVADRAEKGAAVAAAE